MSAENSPPRAAGPPEDLPLHTGIVVDKRLSLEGILRSVTILVPLIGGLWYVSSTVTVVTQTSVENKEAIAFQGTQITHLVDLISATNNLAMIQSNRIDNIGDAIRDMRQTQDKASDRMNGFQTELGRVAREKLDAPNQIR